MSEWKEFPKDKPDLKNEFANYWISDGNHIRYIGLMSIYSELNDQWKYFLKVEQPELPKPKLHYCVSEYYYCIEKCDGLWVGSSDHFHCFYALHCPFCGYSPKASK